MSLNKQKLIIISIFTAIAAIGSGAGAATIFAAPSSSTTNTPATSKTQTFAFACEKKGTHVKIIGGNRLGCTSTGRDEPNQVTLQAVGAKSNTVNPWPNTVELTVIEAKCTGAGNSPVRPAIGSTVTNIKCRSGNASATLAKKSVVKPAKNPSNKVDPYTVNSNGETVNADGSTVSGKNANKSNCDQDPENAVCAPDSGICDGKTCVDPAADPNADCGKQGCDFVKKYINPGINLFSALFGIIAALSLILGGIMYASSGGDPQQVTNAKKRITNTIFAIVAYMFLYGFINFIVPGGLF